ncbi:ribosomal protein L1 [Streptomyces sp. SAI-129]
MSKRSKSLRAADAKIDREKLYAPLEAVRLAKETSTSKFDGTVEVAFRLGVDPRKADQMVRGTVNLPHGTGKTARGSWSSRPVTVPRPRVPRAPTSSAPTS